MEKILKKYTTIPTHLYVNRSADNQLKRIVDEMERPGYVLVARQMGKTNLLFNAMRTLKNINRLFVYVDLSNLYEHEKDCYRNIIDNIIEPNEIIFEPIENKINEIRSQDLPPNKEYSKSLRVILDYFEGDLIIILDEIDALRSADYSDHIFAQIRSSYFSRTNFPIFNRLTYILSGVIEPTDLIKDRNKSPFNIGEKIYLDDFSYEEHNLFIQKSKLKISKDNSDEIFSWTNGNPRLTFDICSEIENYIIDGLEINETIISDIINKKYLTTFDIPPIDHIRELVKSNKSAREAVSSIQKEKNNIIDEIKRKLYLYGIINSNFNEKTIIKNKIIENSLSLKWINTLDDESKTTVSYGLAQFQNREYNDAIETFTKLLDNLSLHDSEIETCNYFLGYAYFNIGEYKKAINYFSYEFKDYSSKKNALSLLASCKLKTNTEEAIQLLEDIIKTETNDFPYHHALLNLATNLPEKDKDRALELYQQLYDSTFKAKDIKKEELNKLRTLALFYQATIYDSQKNMNEALEKIKEAKKYANESDSLYIIFTEYNISENKNEKFKEELINRLVDNKITFDNGYPYPISFSKFHLLHYINLVFDNSDFILFNKILDYAEIFLFENEKNKYEIIYETTYIIDKNREDILNFILKNKVEIDDNLCSNVLKDLSFIHSENPSELFKFFDQYLEVFISSENIVSSDISLFATAIKKHVDNKNFLDGLKLCDHVNEKIEKIEDEDLKFEALIIYYFYAVLYFRLDNKEKSIFYSNKTLNMINESKKERTSAIDEEGLKAISRQMIQIKNSSIIRTPIVKNKSYGRNDKVKVKYLDGKILEKKFKQIEADIIAERCEVIE